MIDVEILSLDGEYLTFEVDSVVVPGVEGHVGFISGRKPFVSLFFDDIVYLFEKQKLSQRFFVESGRVKCFDNKIKILVDGFLLDIDNTNISNLLEENKKLEESIEKLLKNQSSNLYEIKEKENRIQKNKKIIEVYNKVPY